MKLSQNGDCVPAAEQTSSSPAPSNDLPTTKEFLALVEDESRLTASGQVLEAKYKDCIWARSK